MKHLLLLSLLCLPLVAIADTPPPGTVKAKTYSGDGNTAIAATGSALSVNLTNSSLPVTGTFWQATQPVSGTFWQATQPVSLLSLPSLAAGSNLIGSVNINGSVPVTGTFWQATQPVSGTVTANAGTGTFTVDASGHTVPVSGTFWQATQPVSGTVSATVSGTVTANVGTTGGLALDSTVAGLQVLQGSTTSGQSGGLALGAVTTSAPTYTTGRSNPLSLTTTGGLRVDGSGSTQPVSGTVTANAGSGTFTVDGSGHTQPVSGTVTANAGTGTFTVDASGFTVPVTGTFWQATQPVSGTVTANLGTIGAAATAAKQPALGTAGSASSDVLTVQGVTSMTPLKTDGSGVTQPVSGTVTANAGSGTFAVSGTVTANAGSGTFTVDGSGHTQPVSGTFWQATQPVSGTFWQATQPVSIATAPALVASSAIIGKVGIDQTTPGTTNGVQVNAALPAGSNVIGHVIVDTAPSTAVTNAGTFAVQSTPVVPAAVTVKQAAITIGTSAVRLTTDGSAPSATRVLLAAQLLSTSTANCYFGSSGVTSSSTGRGVQMFAGQTLSFNKDAGDYYAICDTSSQTFFITEQE